MSKSILESLARVASQREAATKDGASIDTSDLAKVEQARSRKRLSLRAELIERGVHVDESEPIHVLQSLLDASKRQASLVARAAELGVHLPSDCSVAEATETIARASERARLRRKVAMAHERFEAEAATRRANLSALIEASDETFAVMTADQKTLVDVARDIRAQAQAQAQAQSESDAPTASKRTPTKSARD